MKPQDLPVPAAGRTLQLLEFLLSNPSGVSPQDCLAQLDITRSSLFALLQTLKALGYIEQPEVRGSYLPGPRLLALRGAGWKDPQDLITSFYQESASSPIDETLGLAISSPPNILLLAQREGTHHVRTSYKTGVGYSSEEIAAGPILDPVPSDSIQDIGYYLGEGSESAELAIPICKDGYHPSAALVLSAPRYRHSDQSILSHLPALREMAARLSYRLGAPVYAPYKQPVLSKIEPTTALSEKELATFLQGPWVARLACIRPDGTPHVVPVWHEYNKNEFYVASWGGSKWADYLVANPHVSLTIDEPWPPLRRVSAQGLAQALENDDLPDGIFAILNRLSQRFLGQPLSPEMASRPWQAFRIHTEQVRGWRGLRPASQ
jgi:DNA-binding IclR family transcriptional regulator/nitroimidazol reductase NimA-like FMN-containing flavoprotein (pyridoxamine 5'-phosphate oxidase superfamily)